MPGNTQSPQSISEICVHPQPCGSRAIYLIEPHSARESNGISRLFCRMQSRLQVKQLSRGRLVSYVVQADESDPAVLDELESELRSSCSFVVAQRSFDELIYRIVTELCRDTGSRMLRVSVCNICGKTEPFPTTLVSMSDGDGDVLISRAYCGGCTAAAVAPSGTQFLRSLLAADKKDFRHLARAELVKRPSRKRPLRFRIKTAGSTA